MVLWRALTDSDYAECKHLTIVIDVIDKVVCH